MYKFNGFRHIIDILAAGIDQVGSPIYLGDLAKCSPNYFTLLMSNVQSI